MTEEQGRTEQEELMILSQETRLSLQHERALEMNEAADSIAQTLFNKVNAMKGNGEPTDKYILAMNNLFKRENMQNINYPLMGLQDAIPSSLDPSVLASNHLLLSVDDEYDKRTVYVLVEPVQNLVQGLDTTGDNSDLDSLNKVSPIEKLDAAIQPFLEEDRDFEVRVYINCDTYVEYKALEKEMEDQFEYKVLSHAKFKDKDCTLKFISEYKNAKMYELAEKPVDKFPAATANIASIVDEFYSTFDLIAYRRNSVYFNFRGKEIFRAITNTDFLLLAHSKLRRLLIDETAVSSLADAFTKCWLDLGTNYKHRFEEIEDFFNTPTAVFVAGLSPVFGVITKRSVRLLGTLYDLNQGSEKRVDIELTSASRLGGVFDEEALTALMLKDPRNLMTNVIKLDDQYLRVDTIYRTLVIQGTNRNSMQKSGTFTLENDFSKLTFLTPYYYHQAYEQLGRYVNAVPYRLPERFSDYLKRKASMNGLDVPNFYPSWFTPRNAYLSSILDELGERVSLADILEHNISPLYGLLRDEIIVPIGGSRNVIKG